MLPFIAVAIVMLGGGVAGLLLSLLIGQQKTPSAVETHPQEIAGIMGALGVFAGAYFASVVICALKGKTKFALFGVLAFFAPLAGILPGWGLIVLVIIGAIRLAKPTSKWARRYYGEDKMGAAALRFPQCYTSIRNDSASAIEISRDAPGGNLVQPGRSVTFLGDLSVVGVVIRMEGRAYHYTPFTLQPQPTFHKGRRRYSYVFTAEHAIYPLGPDGAIIRDAPGFPSIRAPSKS